MAQTLDHIDLPHPGSVPAQPMPVVRRIALSDAVDALKEGWADFQAVPTQLVFLGLIYPVVGFIAARTATGDLLPLLFPLIAGLSLMGPILAVGTYELSRRLEAGLPVSAANMLDVFRSRGIAGLIAMAGLLLGIFAAWVLVARAIFVVTVGRGVPGSIGEMLQTVMQSDQGRVLLLAGNLTGAAFAVAVLAISVVSLPLLLDRGGVRWPRWPCRCGQWRATRCRWRSGG